MDSLTHFYIHYKLLQFKSYGTFYFSKFLD